MSHREMPGFSWREVVAAVANLPTAGNVIGDFMYAVSEAELYVWTGSAWEAYSAGGGGGSSDSFSTIQTDEGTAPVATSPTDTLTFTSSDNSIIITGDSSTDTIDFVAAGGGGGVTYPDGQIPYGDGSTTPLFTGELQFDDADNTLYVGAASSSSNGKIIVGGSGTGIGDITGGGGALNISGGPLTLATHSSGQDISFKPGTVTALILHSDKDANFFGNVIAPNTHDIWFGWPSQTAGMQRKTADNNGVALTSGAFKLIVDAGGVMNGFDFASGNAPTVIQFSGGSSLLAVLRGRAGEQFNPAMGVRLNGGNQTDDTTSNAAGFLDCRGGDSASQNARGADGIFRAGNNTNVVGGNGGDSYYLPGTSVAGTPGAAMIGLPSISSSANGGFPYIPTISGTPSGTPTSKTGYVTGPVYEVSTNKIWIYNGSAWKYAVCI